METMSRLELMKRGTMRRVYELIKGGEHKLLGRSRPIETDCDLTMSGRISKVVSTGTMDYGDEYLAWNHYGSSAEAMTMKGLKWIVEEIFNDCDYFCLIDNDEYYDRVMGYYCREIEKSNERVVEAEV